MLERLDYVKIAPQRVLDLGCGTGASLAALGERYPRAQFVGADFSEPMLRAGLAPRTRLRWLMPFLRGAKSALVAADAAASRARSARRAHDVEAARSSGGAGRAETTKAPS